MSRIKRKPLSFNTTMRNPDRLAAFLSVFSKYEGQILTNDIIYEVCYEVIMKKLYVTQTQKQVSEWKMILDSDEYYTRKQAIEIVKLTILGIN